MTYIKSIELSHFRNYEHEKVVFSPHINLFVGSNGQGKTNCLEALALLVAGRSFRTSMLKECIRHEQSQFQLKSHFVKSELEQTLKVSYGPHQKQCIYNATQYSSFVPLIGILNGVLFAGFYDQLIKGSPQIRRRFLDLQSSQEDRLYLNHLRHFQKALKERNCLLRQKKQEMLLVYEELMAQSIPYLMSQRHQCLEALQMQAQLIHQELTHLEDPIKLKLISPFSNGWTSSECLALLKQHREKDLQMGYTHVGPHKDEVQILLNNMPAKKFGSEGQIQTLMTSIYLAEYQRLAESVNEKPLFFIDDLGQNLDASRLFKLLEKLENMGQVFITTPSIPNYSFKKPAAIFEVSNGKIYAANPCTNAAP